MPTPDGHLTQPERAAYVVRGYGHCPFCKSDQLDGESLTVELNKVTQPVGCSACGKTWTDVYTLTAIVEED